jgi:hypothetical protein
MHNEPTLIFATIILATRTLFVARTSATHDLDLQLAPVRYGRRCGAQCSSSEHLRVRWPISNASLRYIVTGHDQLAPSLLLSTPCGGSHLRTTRGTCFYECMSTFGRQSVRWRSSGRARHRLLEFTLSPYQTTNARAIMAHSTTVRAESERVGASPKGNAHCYFGPLADTDHAHERTPTI